MRRNLTALLIPSKGLSILAGEHMQHAAVGTRQHAAYAVAVDADAADSAVMHTMYDWPMTTVYD